MLSSDRIPLYEHPYAKFVFAGGELEVGRVVFEDREVDHHHMSLMPRDWLAAGITEYVAGWLSLKSETVIASSTPQWARLNVQLCQACQAAISTWARRTGRDAVFADR